MNTNNFSDLSQLKFFSYLCKSQHGWPEGYSPPCRYSRNQANFMSHTACKLIPLAAKKKKKKKKKPAWWSLCHQQNLSYFNSISYFYKCHGCHFSIPFNSQISVLSSFPLMSWARLGCRNASFALIICGPMKRTLVVWIQPTSRKG